MTDAQALLATARRATSGDLDEVIQTLTLAFVDDPVWRPTMSRVPGDVVVMSRFWEALCRSMLRYEWVWMLDDAAAVSAWLPPGGVELPQEDEHRFKEFVRAELGDDGMSRVEAVFDCFERAHPKDEPHFYLSLLGTNPRWRGNGLGVGLLRANLELIDTQSLPTYLESSNPANDARYGAAGYRKILDFELPAGQIVTGMWRPSGG